MIKVADGQSSSDIRADAIALHLIAVAGNYDPGVPIAGDNIAGTEHRAADGIVGSGKDDAVVVAEGRAAGKVGADEIALDDVFCGRRSENFDPGIQISGNKIGGLRGEAADGRRAAAMVNAGGIANGNISCDIRADEVTLDNVAGAGINRETDIEVTGNQVAAIGCLSADGIV